MTTENPQTIKEAVYDAFMISSPDYKEMHIDDITLVIQYRNSFFKDFDTDVLRKQVSSCMASSTTKILKGKRVLDNESLYERVKNGKGGFKKGVYRLRRPKAKKEKPIPLAVEPILELVSDAGTGYVGSAGEMSVCSELLFRGYNVSRMSVDDGVDIVAIKNGKTFYIQVKTVQVKNATFGVRVNGKSFDRYSRNDCYYIVVARTEIKKVPLNQFLIATADDINRLISIGDAKQNNGSISISFSQEMGSIFVKSSNVDYMLNSFERIK